jgi:hypothetical protein
MFVPPPPPKVVVISDHAKGIVLLATCKPGQHAAWPVLHVYFGMTGYATEIERFLNQPCEKDDNHNGRTRKETR